MSAGEGVDIDLYADDIGEDFNAVSLSFYLVRHPCALSF